MWCGTVAWWLMVWWCVHVPERRLNNTHFMPRSNYGSGAYGSGPAAQAQAQYMQYYQQYYQQNPQLMQQWHQ